MNLRGSERRKLWADLPAAKVLPANTLSVLQEVYAAHSARLASALVIMNSYASSLAFERTATAAAHGSIVAETSIFAVLSPLHPDGLAPDTPPRLMAAAAENDERLASAFAIVSTLADSCWTLTVVLVAVTTFVRFSRPAVSYGS